MESAARKTGVEEEPAASIDWSEVRFPGLGPGTVVLITGGSGAVGLEVAGALVRMGADVGIVGRAPERVAEAAAGLPGPGRALALVADVTDLASMQRAVDELVARFGEVAVLVNSAGVGTQAQPFGSVSGEEIDTVLSVNVKGTLYAAMAVVPSMQRRGGGKIVNISSVAAYAATSNRLIYGASKAAVLRLTKQLAVDLGSMGITANSVSPGNTPTDLRGWDEPSGAAPVPATSTLVPQNAIPAGRRGHLEDYVGAVLFFGSSLAEFVTGTDLPVEGGVLAKL